MNRLYYLDTLISIKVLNSFHTIFKICYYQMTHHAKGHATTSSLFLFISLNTIVLQLSHPLHYTIFPSNSLLSFCFEENLDPFSHFSLGAFGCSKNRAILIIAESRAIQTRN